MKIIEAQANHLDIVCELFREYKQTVSEDGSNQCFSGFEVELASLPGSYTSPKGVIYLAVSDDQNINNDSTVGCVAIKPRDGKPSEAELKRLYVRQNKRSSGTGKQLMNQAIQFAKDKQYASVFLETVASMEAAKSLYSRYGFESAIDPEQAQNSTIECYEYVFNKDAS